MNQASKDLFFTVNDIAEQDLDYLTELRDKIARPSIDVTVTQADAVRRMYVRVFITQVESAVATIKNDVLEASHQLTDSERAVLRDVTFDLNEKGEAFERPLHPPLRSSIRFAFRMFAKVHGLQFIPDYTAQGWNDMQTVLKIRNRLTHPKDADQMVVSDADLHQVDSAEFWFRQAHRGLLQEYHAILKQNFDRSHSTDA